MRIQFNQLKSLLTLILSFTIYHSFSQNNFAIVSYGTESYYPREIFFGDTGEVYFAGQCSIRGSINNEVSWNGYCYTPLYIMGGCSPSLGNTFVVGKGGLIRKNSACEIFGSWSTQNSGTTDTLYSIKFYDINTGVIVGQNGRILRTYNNGRLWSNMISGTTASLRNLIFKPDSSLIACGANGTILASPDKGITWNPQTTGVTTLLADIDFPTNDTGYAVGRNGVMIKTTDGGTTWNPLNTGVLASLNTVDFVDASTGIIAGSNGLIMRTNDGGATWTNLLYLTTYDVYDVKFKNKTDGYLVTIFDALKTTDGGLNWYSMGSILKAVKYLNDTTLIAVGDKVVKKSTDGGQSWNTIRPLPATDWLNCDFPTPDTGYICGVSGRIMKTTDGGQTFSQQITNAPTFGGNYYYGIHFFDKNHGIAVGSQYMISRTSNGGQTWSTTYSSSGASGYGYYDIFFLNNQIGWVCGSKGTMKKTIDGGATFTLQTTGVQNFLLDIYFLNSQKGFACGESGLLLKTIDGGTTWTSTYLSSSNALYSIAFRDSLHGYISGDSQLLYATSDGGTTWKYLNNSFTMRAITFRSPYIGYAVGPNDTKLYFDPIKTLNGYTRACKGTSTSFVPKLVSGINILPGNNFIMEMDTTGNDFNDALFLGAYPDTSSSSYWYFNIPATLKAGVYSVRVRATATTPVYKSMITNMTVYDDAEASIAVRNDTLFANYNPKYLYQWRLGFTNIVGANNYYYVPTAGGNYTLEVQYGCCNYAEASVNITSCATGILVAPQTSGTFVLGCDSSAFTLKATDAVGYRWYDSDTSTVILSTNSTYTTPVLTVRDTFYVAAFNGTCESSRVPIVTDFASKPSAPTVLGDSVCEGNEAFLFTPGNNYSHWFTDSLSTIDLQTSASFQIHSLINTDTFYVSNFNYQCESKRTPVIAYAVEKPVTTSILGDTTVAIGDTATYFYTPSAGNSFQWITVGGTIISQNDSLILKWDSIVIGKVGIVESNMLGCKSDTLWLAVTVDFGLVIRQLGKNQIGVSPNPASNKIVLERTNSTKTETILVYDSNGKMVIKTIITAGKNQVVIDTSKLSAGTYYIMSNDNIQVQEGKFVIVR